MGEVIDIFQAQEQEYLVCEECDGEEFSAIRVGGKNCYLVCLMCDHRMIGIQVIDNEE